MGRIKRKNIRKQIAVTCLAVLIFCVVVLPVSAAKSTGEPVISDFRTETEISYTTSRARAVTAGTIQWKVTDSSASTINADGLKLTKGFLSLGKDNPVNAAEGFEIDVVYSSEYEDAEANAEAAFLFTSDAVYNTNMLFSDSASLIGIAENGDVYHKGTKLNHAGGAEAADVLNAKNTAIAPGEACTLSIKYLDGKLSVSLSYGTTTRELLSGYACTITGLRQLQIGADRSGDKRQDNVTYQQVRFSCYENSAPEETPVEETSETASGLAAIVTESGERHEYTSAASAVSDALKFAEQGKETLLKLQSNIKTGAITVKSGMKLTVDLNGYVLDRNCYSVMSSTGYVFLLQNGAALTVKDSAPNRGHDNTSVCGGIITGGAGDDVGGGFQLLDDSALIMTGGSVMSCSSNDHGAAIRVKGDGVSISLSNVGFYSNFTYDSADNCHGGAVYGDDDCKISMNGCIFEGNYSEDNGGAVYMNEGTLEARDCLFIGNKCLDEGGAVYLESGTYATLDGCTFYDNRADGDGGAVYCNSDDGTRLSGVYRCNSCGGNGGAVYVDDDGVFIMDAEICENTAGKHGSGVYVDELNDVNVQGQLTIRDNFNASGEKDNLYLAHVLTTEAKIYNGGLYDGSEVYVGMTDKNHTVAENISAYQTRFFFSDADGKLLSFTADDTKTERQTLITSAIGTGNIIFIAVCSVAVIAALICVIVIGKKKQKGDESK